MSIESKQSFKSICDWCKLTQYDFNQNSTSQWNKSRMEERFYNDTRQTKIHKCVSYKLELLEQEQSVITIYLSIDSFKLSLLTHNFQFREHT